MSPFDPRSREFFGSSRPKRVEGGIKARSTRGAIGSSWWSRRFIDTLEGLAVGGRLARGRAYARQGQVLSLDLSPGTVQARVQGSRSEPYRVTLAVEPFGQEVWAAVEQALAEEAIYSAHLLAGAMPTDIEDVFAAAGAPLFPARRGDLAMSCSCPDWEVPCKHLAAAIYLLGERFDADPFQILAWRGRDRIQLLSRLRELRGITSVPEAAPEPAAEDEPRPAVLGARAALADLAEPSGAGDPGRFWLAPVPLPARPASLAVPADLLLRQLPTPSAALGGPVLADRLRPAYEAFSDAE